MTVSEAVDLFLATAPGGTCVALGACLAICILARRIVGGLFRGGLRPLLPFGLVFTLAWLWLCFVSLHVPEPYLVRLYPLPFSLNLEHDSDSSQDEVFHIPQAQKYCDGKWAEWDDKITTPPGL